MASRPFIALIGVALMIAGPLVPVRAMAQPRTAAGLLAHYQDLSREAELVNEKLLAAREELQERRWESRRATAAARAAVVAADEADEKLSAARELDRITASAVTPLSVLLTSESADELRDQLEGADLLAALAGDLSGRSAERVYAAEREAERAKARAVRAQDWARTRYARSVASARKVKERKAALDARIAEVRAALDDLTAEQRALLAAVEDPGTDVAIPNGVVGTVLDFAMAQLGVPYLWGATGPDGYDCSGLVQTAFHVAGIALPRVSRDQATVGMPVSRMDVRAGDLVFYYEPVHHVAIAVDRDRAIHAPSFGETIKLAPIDAIGPITVIRRVIG